MRYEFHLTNDARSVRSLNQKMDAFRQGTPILAIDNLDKEGYLIDTHWMTAEKASLQGGHVAALRYLSNCQNAKGWYQYTTCNPYRMKIEAEYDDTCVPEEFLYIETHFSVTPEEAQKRSEGISRNVFSGELIATERCYDPSKFRDFYQCHSGLMGRKVELCLYDTGVNQDAEEGWMKVPKNLPSMSALSYKSLSNELGKIFKRGISAKVKFWEVS